MEARPKLDIGLTKIDKLLETICLTLLLLLWVTTIAFYGKLPDQIPTHFNVAGRPDDFNNKQHIFVLPIIATVIYIGMTIINKYPHIYNYPAIITKENATRLYTSATKFIRVLKLVVVVIFSGIVFMMYKTSLTNSGGLGTWFLPFALGLLVVPSIFYLLDSIKKTKGLK